MIFLSISNVSQVIQDFCYAGNSRLRGKIWRIWGVSTPSGLKSSTGPPKGTLCTGNTYFKPSLTSVGGSVRAVANLGAQEKQNKKAHKNFIFHVCVGCPRKAIVMIFDTARGLADVIKCTKFYIDRFRVSDLARVKVGASHNKPQRPLPLCVALSCTHEIEIEPAVTFIASCATNQLWRQMSRARCIHPVSVPLTFSFISSGSQAIRDARVRKSNWKWLRLLGMSKYHMSTAVRNVVRVMPVSKRKS